MQLRPVGGKWRSVHLLHLTFFFFWADLLPGATFGFLVLSALPLSDLVTLPGLIGAMLALLKLQERNWKLEVGLRFTMCNGRIMDFN